MSKKCIDPSQPNTLLCFTAHKTDLLDFHLEQLKNIVAKVAKSHKGKRPIVLIRLTGHAATWRGITKIEYWTRGFVRANNASFFLIKELRKELKKIGVSMRKIAFVSHSEADDKPIHTNKTKDGRALNRRVEITLERGIVVKRKKGRCVAGDKIKAAPIKDVAKDKVELRGLKCLQLFLSEAMCGKNLDGRFWKFRPASGGVGFGLNRITKPADIIKMFKFRFDEKDKPEKTAKDIRFLFRFFNEETNKLLGYLHSEAGNAGNLEDYTECAWALELIAASERRKPKSIYRCMKKELASTKKVCSL